MKHVRFYQIRHDGKLASLLGTDGVMPVDGRLNTARIIYAAQEQRARLARVKPGIVAARIYRNGRAEGPVYDLTTWPSASWSEPVRAAIEAGVVE